MAGRLSAELSKTGGSSASITACGLLDYIKQEGRDSAKVKARLEAICHDVKKSFSDEIKVWFGYEPKNRDVPVFVAEVKEKNDDAIKELHGLKVVQRVEEEVGVSPAEGNDNSESKEKLIFSDKELRICMEQNTDILLNSHSNIQAIMGSDKILHEKTKTIEKKTCVVIYVRIKGIIPFYEEEFQLENNDFPIDVREGRTVTLVNRLLPHEYMKSVRMGCKIMSANASATLAGFLELSNEKIGCLTVWHLFDTGEGEHTEELLKSPDFNKNVYQPFMAKRREYNFGSVIRVSRECDTALIEIDQPKRLPRNGFFPNAVCPEQGFPASKPMKFDTGDIINGKDEMELKSKCRVVKYGAASQATSGTLEGPCGASRVHLRNGRGYYIRKLIGVRREVGSSKAFSVAGDSGSLVFLEDDEQLRALGILVGMLESKDDTELALVVPIWEILQCFKLPLRLLSFEEPWDIGLDQLQAQMTEVNANLNKVAADISTVRQQVAKIAEMTQRINAAETKSSHENTNQMQ